MNLTRYMHLKYLLMILFGFVFFFFINKFRAFFIFFSLLIIAAISRTYNYFFKLHQLGFELYSSSTILTGLLLGPWYGLLQGILSNLFATLLSGKVKYYVYISMASWGIIGFICGFLQNFDITTIGIFFIILYELITAPLFFFSGARITSVIFHTVTHIVIVTFLFQTTVPIIYGLLR